MSETISQVNSGGLSIRLTNEKLFIDSSISKETFAVRSIDGIGIVDLMDDYIKELSERNSKKSKGILLLIIGAIIFLYLINLEQVDYYALMLFVIASVPFSIGIILLSNLKNVKLISVVRIMMRGGVRDFKFDKSDSSKNEIAAFVASVEETFTAYH
jgi:hypothetical protein